METFRDIKSLWQSDELDNLPQLAEIEDLISKFSQKKKRNNILAILVLIVMIVMLFLVATYGEFEIWSTYFGIMLWVCMASYAFPLKIKKQNKLSGLETLPNHGFLNALENEENQVCIGKSKNQTQLFIIWMIGFSFYIYEIIHYSVNFLLLGYGALMIFIFVVWFLYIPFMVRGYQKSIQKTIDHVNRLRS